MEQREEIKDGVKQRIIEFMAEQITKEESFIDLKSELVEELFRKKEIKAPIIKNEPLRDLSTFSVVATKAEDSLQKIKDRQAEYYKKILDVKLGKATNENVQRLIKQLQDKDSTSYLDVLDQLNGKKVPDYNEFIIDPLLKTDFNSEKRQELQDSSLSTLKEILVNPFSNSLEAHVNYYSNEENYRKEYSVFDKNQNFRFECCYVYNKATNQKYIDKFSVDSKGFLLSGDELGIPFAIAAMDLVDQAEETRQAAIKMIEKKSRKPATPRKKKVTKK